VPNIFRASIEQDDCPHTLLTSKYRDLTIFIMNAYREKAMQHSFSIFYSPSGNILTASISDLEKYPGMTDISIIGKKNNLISLTYSFPRTSAYKTISTLGFRMHPVMVRSGIERWFFVSSKPDVPGVIREKLNDGRTRLISINRLTTDEFVSEYSKFMGEFWKTKIVTDAGLMNTEILDKAVQAGYYDWPRKSSLSELSKEVKIPRTTLTYKLRKAEKDIFENLKMSEE
jgi:predicted DNA binding protein